MVTHLKINKLYKFNNNAFGKELALFSKKEPFVFQKDLIVDNNFIIHIIDEPILVNKIRSYYHFTALIMYNKNVEIAHLYFYEKNDFGWNVSLNCLDELI